MPCHPGLTTRTCYRHFNQWRDSDTEVRADAVALEGLALLREDRQGI